VRKEETISRCPTTRKHLVRQPHRCSTLLHGHRDSRRGPSIPSHRSLFPFPPFLSQLQMEQVRGGGGGVEELISRRQTLRKQLDVPDTQVCCSSSWSSGQSSPTRSSPRQVRKPGRSPDLSSATQSFLFSHRLPKPKCRTSSTQMQIAVCPVDLFLE
jgi:hypothetical protein